MLPAAWHGRPEGGEVGASLALLVVKEEALGHGGQHILHAGGGSSERYSTAAALHWAEQAPRPQPSHSRRAAAPCYRPCAAVQPAAHLELPAHAQVEDLGDHHFHRALAQHKDEELQRGWVGRAERR